MPGKHLEHRRTWKLVNFNCACNEENCTEWVKMAPFQWNKSCVQWKYRNTQWKWGKQWCGTCLRAKQMQNGAREKYWNMENEKSLWCNRRAEQWSNWWRIVWRRLWQKLWTKIFFRWHFLKIHVLTVPIMCPTWLLQWVFFSGLASELKIPLFKGSVLPPHFQVRRGTCLSSTMLWLHKAPPKSSVYTHVLFPTFELSILLRLLRLSLSLCLPFSLVPFLAQRRPGLQLNGSVGKLCSNLILLHQSHPTYYWTCPSI